MSREKMRRQQAGFTILEVAVVVLVAGAIMAFATPKFVNAMREYRVSMASRQLTDMIHRAKMQAVSDNRGVTLRIDTAANRMGLVVLDVNGVEVTTQYVPLPQGVTFSRPANVSAPMTGAPTGGSVSFTPKTGSTTIFEQQFNSRGFLVVASPATIQAIYVGNGQDYRAITMTSVGGIRTWRWTAGQWYNTRVVSS
jgi:prepilin-type N-terminal cleavage/methylation domain-containing protein